MAALKFNKEIAGMYATIKNGALLYYSDNMKNFVAATYSIGSVRTGNMLTGWFFTSTNMGDTFYQLENMHFVGSQDIISITTNNTQTVTVKSVNDIINGIIRANKHILENNLFCARFAYKLTDDEKNSLRALQNRLEVRNKSLLDDSMLSRQQVSFPIGYAEYGKDLEAFMNRTGAVGSVTAATVVAIATLVIKAVVVAGVAYAAYWAYKSYLQQANKDVKYSDELTKTLMSKLTPDEYEQLKRETSEIVTKATLSAKFSTSFGWVKYLAIAAVGFVGFKYLSGFINNQQ